MTSQDSGSPSPASRRRFPTPGQLGRGIIRLPLTLVRFIVLLPVRVVRFLIRLPHRIWDAWTRAAQGVYRLRMGLRELRRQQRLHLPRSRITQMIYFHLHPRRVWHGWQALRTRLQPAVWDAHPGLSIVRPALRWARQYRRHRSRFRDIEALRSHLNADDTVFEDRPLHPTLSLLARQSWTPKRWGAFLHGLIRYGQGQRVLELGTGYGMSGLYMAQSLLENYPMRTCYLITLEQDRSCVDKATYQFRRLKMNDFTSVRQGDISHLLDRSLADIRPPDLVFVDMGLDAPAVKTAVDKVLPEMTSGDLLVLTGIHRTRGMFRLWQALKAHQHVTATVDLWRWGVLVAAGGHAPHGSNDTPTPNTEQPQEGKQPPNREKRPPLHLAAKL